MQGGMSVKLSARLASPSMTLSWMWGVSLCLPFWVSTALSHSSRLLLPKPPLAPSSQVSQAQGCLWSVQAEACQDFQGLGGWKRLMCQNTSSDAIAWRHNSLGLKWGCKV